MLKTDELEKCEHWDCPMYHWGSCTGDKEFAVEHNICQKKQEAD